MIKFDTPYLNITALRSVISAAKEERDLLMLHGCNAYVIDSDVITNDLYRNRMIAIKQAAKKTYGRVPVSDVQRGESDPCDLNIGQANSF